jgi:uncharacterized membrane protein
MVRSYHASLDLDLEDRQMARSSSWGPLTVALAVASAICDGLVIVRVARTEEFTYAYMPGNLVLAWLPLVFALGVRASVRMPNALATPSALLCCALWMLFLPNAPYMVTDIMHYRVTSELPVWYDAVLFGSFALTSVWLGVAALFLMHELVDRAGGVAVGWLFALASVGASGVGVYFGRVLRWNSWDAARSPELVLSDAVVLLRHPVEHQAAWALIVASSLFFCAAYLVFYGTTRLGARAGTVTAP